MKLPENVTNLLKSGTPGGVAITKAEIDTAKVQLTNGQLVDVARKLSDAFADGNVVSSIAERIGPNAVPAPLNALADHPVGKAWLDGSLKIKKGTPNTDGIWILQRALVKIGVHHPQGKTVGALLQLPYGADRDLGQGTINALNEALKLAGKPELANLTVNSEIGKSVAEAIDTLLKQTTKIVHPSTIQVPPGAVKKLVVYVGMGDHSPTEAKALANAMGSEYELRKIIDSKLGDDIVQHNGTTYDLKEAAGREKFANEAFVPPLSADQKAKVLSALNAGAWGIADARDEIAEVALAMHEVETSNGTKTMPFFYISGHSGSNDIWGDHNGSFPMEALDALTSGFPKAASTIEAPFFAA